MFIKWNVGNVLIMREVQGGEGILIQNIQDVNYYVGCFKERWISVFFSFFFVRVVELDRELLQGEYEVKGFEF